MIDLTFLRTLSLKEKDKIGFQFSTEERARTIETIFFFIQKFSRDLISRKWSKSRKLIPLIYKLNVAFSIARETIKI